MNLRPAICFLTLSFSIACIQIVNAQVKPKQQAKDLDERAKGEGNDRVKQVQDYCMAAQLEPKDKKYSEACNSSRTALIQDDTAWLANAIAAYKNHDLDKAESQARLVTSYDDKLSSQARVLLDRIRNERLVSQIQTAWTKGDFQTVTTLAQGITSPDLKATANVYINDVGVYKGFIEQAQKVAQSNPQDAIKQLTLARDLNPNGPDDPAGKIAALQKTLQAKAAAPAPVLSSKSPADTSADLARKVNKLIADAKNSEKQGDLPHALNNYETALKLQPGNADAQSNFDRVEQTIKNDPAAAKNELIAAIRSFYSSQFDDAQKALSSYLQSPETAQDPGAADFYLGATLIERSMLQTPRAQWKGPSPEALSAFQQARKVNYAPVRAYVSPILLKIWDSTGP